MLFFKKQFYVLKSQTVQLFITLLISFCFVNLILQSCKEQSSGQHESFFDFDFVFRFVRIFIHLFRHRQHFARYPILLHHWNLRKTKRGRTFRCFSSQHCCPSSSQHLQHHLTDGRPIPCQVPKENDHTTTFEYRWRPI